MSHARYAVVGWYRRDRTRKLLLTLLPAMLSMALGSLVVGYGVTNRPYAEERAARRGTVTYETVAELQEATPGEVKGVSLPDLSLQGILFLVGFALVAAGPIMVIAGLRSALGAEDYLLLRTDALFYYLNGSVTEISWDDIERISYAEKRDALNIELKDGNSVLIEERFANLANQALAKDLETARRKIIWNILPIGLRRP